jgi:hypothetical protein
LPYEKGSELAAPCITSLLQLQELKKEEQVFLSSLILPSLNASHARGMLEVELKELQLVID